MTYSNDKHLIFDIFFCFCRIQYYVENTTELKLKNDPKTRDAIAYNMWRIGYSIKKLPGYLKSRYNHFPWDQLELFSNVNYYREDQTWTVVKHQEVGVLNHFNEIADIFEQEYPKEFPENFNRQEIIENSHG